MGKAYANKKKKEDRPVGDFYSTPKSLVWVVKDIILKEFPLDCNMLEPCAGKLAIFEELSNFGYLPIWSDLYPFNNQYIKGKNYLTCNWDKFEYIITNPPFSLWDDFVFKAKTHCNKFMFIGRLNYFGTNSRYKLGIWNNLKAIYIFNRYVDYQTPYREDGDFHVGSMTTGWFLWDMNYVDKPILEILDVQKYATLGNFKNKK